MPYSNPLTQAELQDLAIHNPLHPRDGSPSEQYMPQAYFMVPPPTQAGPVRWRLFDAAYISTGIIDPNRLGTGAVGDGNLYLADDGTWKPVSTGGGSQNLQQVTDLGSTTTNAITTNGVTSDYFRFDTLATPTPTTGMMFWDQDSQTPDVQLDSALAAKMFQDEFWYVKNQTGSQINKGTVVMAVGTLGASSRILVAPMIANGSVPAKYILGIAAENIPDGGDGSVMRVGKIRNLNTTAFAAGDVLYANPAVAGGLTNVLPSAPNLKLAVAFVVHSATNGVLAVRVEVGSDLYEDHRVQVSSPTDGQLLRYDNADQRWENWTPNFLTSFTETDPIFTASPSFGITSTLINNWNTAYSWGNHATVGYLTAESDTLDSVTGRGNTTANTVGVGSLLVNNPTPAGYNLDVNGDIRAKGLFIDANAGNNAYDFTIKNSVFSGEFLQCLNTSNTRVIALNKFQEDGYFGLYNSTGAQTIQFVLAANYITTQLSIGSTVTGLYTLDVTGTARVTSTLTANSFVKTGGTSSQFLKADGSVDSNTYYLASNPNGYTINTGTVTSVGLSSTTSGITIAATPVTTSGTITINIATASGSQNGLLSSADWTTFNNKQNALTNPVTGTGAAGQVAFWNATNTQTGSNNLLWDNTNTRLTIGVLAQAPQGSIHTSGQGIFEGGLAFQYDAGAGAYQPNFTYSTASGGYLNIQSWNGKPIYINTLGNNVYFGGGGSGNVTIGANSSAGFKLDVNGNTRVQGTITLTGNIQSTNGGNSQIDFLTTIGSGTNDLTLRSQDQMQIVVGYGSLIVNTGLQLQGGISTGARGRALVLGGGEDYIITSNNFGSGGYHMKLSSWGTQIQFGPGSGIGEANFAPKFTMTSSTRFGIGTTDPASKLEVYDGNASLRLSTYAATARYGFGNPARADDAAYIEYQGVGNFTGSLIFATNGVVSNVAATEKMRITGIGNVGIGTSTPAYKLQVQGTVSAALNPGTHPDAVYYNSTTGELTFGPVPAVGGGGTVTSVAMTVPTGLSVSGSPITSAGTLALTLTSGYSIPTTASQANWDAAFSWGDHSLVGYLTSYTETDPTVPSHVKAITTTQVSNWDAAFGWGNHAGLYAPIVHTHSATDITSGTLASARLSGTYAISISGTAAVASVAVLANKVKSSDTRAVVTTPQTNDVGIVFDFKSNSTNGLSDGGAFNGVMYWRKYGNTTDWTGGGAIEIAYTDNGNLWHRYGTNTAWGSWRKVWNSNDFSATNISNWNTAYTWGDHAGLYAPITHTHVIADVTGLQGALDSKAPLASPALTGTPTAPTAATSTNTTQIATTAFVKAQGYTTNTGTVTSVAMSVPTGLVVSGSPITTSGTLAVTFASGYSIPTTTKQTEWDTAYSWGNHASAGYVTLTTAQTITGVKSFARTLNIVRTINAGDDVNIVLNQNSLVSSGFILNGALNAPIGGNLQYANIGAYTLASTDGSGTDIYIRKLHSPTNFIAWTRLYTESFHPEADRWTTARTLTIGNTGKSVDGTNNVSWTVAEIGALPLLTPSSLNVNAANATGVYLGSTGVWSNRGPSGNNAGALITLNTHPGDYYSQFWFNTAANAFYHRTANASLPTATWQRVYQDDYHPTADTWTTARTLTIGNTGKSVNGSANVSWTLAEIGAQAALTNPVTGTGTTNYVPKFTAGTVLGNSLIFDNGTRVGIGTNTPSDPLSVNGALTSVFVTDRFKKYTILPGGYVETNPVNFRFDESATAYAGEYGTITFTGGTAPSADSLKGLFTFQAGYINLFSHKDASNNLSIELSNIALSNSANTNWKPYVFFHGSGGSAGTLTIELKDGANNWATYYNGPSNDFVMNEFYLIPVGVLRGVRYTFTGITGNSYLRMIGVIGKTVAPYAWNVLKSGGTFYGDIDIKDGTTQKIKFTKTTGDVLALGKMSLGTTSSLAQLHIKSDLSAATANSIYLQNTASGGSEGVSILFDPMFGAISRIASNREGGAADKSNLRFITYSASESEKMRITAAGNVLIGTTTEGIYKLDVVGTSRFVSSSFGLAANSLFVGNASGDGRNVALFLGDASVYNTASNTNTVTASVAGIRFDWYSDNWRISATRGGGTDIKGLVFSRNNSEQMIIDSTGYVGINNNNPFSRLQISDSVTGNAGLTIHNNLEVANNAASIWFKVAGSPADYRKGAIFFANNGTGHGRGSLFFALNDVANSAAATSADARMTIVSGGNVGIGTITPQHKLDITVGNVQGLRVQSANSGFLEVGKSGNAKWRWANDYTSAHILELQVNNLVGGDPNQNVLSVFGSSKNVSIGTTTDNGLAKLQVNGGITALLPPLATADIVYYNPATQLFSYGPVPSGGSGTVTSVSGTGTVSGLTLSGTVTTSGNLTLGGTLSVTPSNFSSQTANTFLAAPNGAAGVPTFRLIVASDIPTLNQNTTGSAASLTTARTFTIGNTGKTFNGTANVSWTLAEIGAYAASNPNGYTSNTGTVTSIVAGTGLSGGTITTSGTIGLANTTVTPGAYTNANITVDAQGRITAAANGSGGSAPTPITVSLGPNTFGNVLYQATTLGFAGLLKIEYYAIDTNTADTQEAGILIGTFNISSAPDSQLTSSGVVNIGAGMPLMFYAGMVGGNFPAVYVDNPNPNGYDIKFTVTQLN